MQQDRLILRRETQADYEAVEHLTREAFWNVYRPGCLEHYVVHVLRQDPALVPELDLVLERDGELVGHVLYLRAAIAADGGREIPVMTFSPISIRPDCQRQGLGRYLLERSMELARTLGAGALCIEGNLDFYGKSGFVVAGTRGIRYHGAPDPGLTPYFLLKELEPGYLDGVIGIYYTPQGYFVDEAAAEAFDRGFPPKEKLRLPGQLFGP